MDLGLKDKRILLLVSGGIAIYKTLDLISRLKKMGANVFVVMSNKATRFIHPRTFQAMSGNIVLYKNSESFPQISHISYAKDADVAILAPATINTIAKLNYGIADNLIVETLLACKCEVFIAPSANINMLESPQNKANLASLKKLGYQIIPPRISRLACDIIANGAMAEVSEIIFALQKSFTKQHFWSDKNIIITGGGSIEALDKIRHISNDSSGKQASNLALAFYMLGANITLIASKFPLDLPLDIVKIPVKTSLDFKNNIEKTLKNHIKATKLAPKNHNILLMAAAISDFVPEKIAQGKIKKDKIGTKWQLNLIENMDILRQIASEFCNSCFIVGFKAESFGDEITQKERDLASLNAKKMLVSKHCDMVILNIISKLNNIGDDCNEISIFTHKKELKIPKNNKLNISFEIAKILEKTCATKDSKHC